MPYCKVPLYTRFPIPRPNAISPTLDAGYVFHFSSFVSFFSMTGFLKIRPTLHSRVAIMSLALQIALPAKWAPKYTILGGFLATGALYWVLKSLRQKYSLSLSSYPLPPPYL